MKVLVLGGCGAQGTFATRELVASDEVSELIIGDYNVERARRVASEIGSEKLGVEKVDVRDRGALVDLMRKVDVVVNCVGPFYMYGPMVLSAAIEAGRSYVDICDDADATVKMLEMNDKARDAGISAVIGLGASPGITNILSVYLAREFDRVDEIRQYWVVDSSSDPEGMAVMYHAAHGMSGRTPQFINGKLEWLKAGSGAEKVEFLGGKATVVYFGHPEPITIPKYVEGVKTVINKGGFLPSSDFTIFRILSRLGFFSEKKIAGVSPRRLTVTFLTKTVAKQEMKEATRTAIRLEMTGESGGETLKLVAHLKGHMGPATGMPAAIGALMLINEEVEVKGVLPPEACIDPDTFIKRARERIEPGAELVLEKTYRGPLFD